MFYMGPGGAVTGARVRRRVLWAPALCAAGERLFLQIGPGFPRLLRCRKGADQRGQWLSQDEGRRQTRIPSLLFGGGAWQKSNTHLGPLETIDELFLRFYRAAPLLTFCQRQQALISILINLYRFGRGGDY